jgi:hypothetical protein
MGKCIKKYHSAAKYVGNLRVQTFITSVCLPPRSLSDLEFDFDGGIHIAALLRLSIIILV